MYFGFFTSEDVGWIVAYLIIAATMAALIPVALLYVIFRVSQSFDTPKERLVGAILGTWLVTGGVWYLVYSNRAEQGLQVLFYLVVLPFAVSMSLRAIHNHYKLKRNVTYIKLLRFTSTFALVVTILSITSYFLVVAHIYLST